MNDIIKRVANFERINQIYSHNLFTVKSIAQYLGRWDDLSEDEKIKIETLTSADSLLNGHTEDYLNKLKEYKSEKLGYGEIVKSGSDNLYNYIKNNIGISENDVFYDIGSGNGKLVIHFALISDFKFVKGIEINDMRYLYSLEILNKIGEIENLILINDDVLNLDLSDATIVFMNDTLFSQDLISNILSKLKKGTHIISLEENSLEPVGEVLLDVSWMPIPTTFRHYIK